MFGVLAWAAMMPASPLPWRCAPWVAPAPPPGPAFSIASTASPATTRSAIASAWRS
ncbi:MAG TPA: hypothetical protein VHW23_13090 [Kofleriaceae bacterium]|nr:hypothetical protein [Kofleriaceae bacterium]